MHNYSATVFQCLTDESWMKPDVDNGFEEIDPCMLNPMNCTEGFSWSVWEKMMFGPDVVTGSTKKQYIMSTGGDYNAAKGHAWPGFALYHQVLKCFSIAKATLELQMSVWFSVCLLY